MPLSSHTEQGQEEAAGPTPEIYTHTRASFERITRHSSLPLFILLGLGLFLVGTILFFLFRNSGIITGQKKVWGNYTLSPGETLILDKNGEVHTNGNITIAGNVSCKNGPIRLIADGTITISGTLTCIVPTDPHNNSNKDGLILLAKGDIIVEPSAEIATNGNVLVLRGEKASTLDPSPILRDTPRMLANMTDGTARIGPFVPEQITLSEIPNTPNTPHVGRSRLARSCTLGGNWLIGGGMRTRAGMEIPPSPSSPLLFRLDCDDDAILTLRSLTLSFGDAQKGESIIEEGCTAAGQNGSDGAQTVIRSGQITIENSRITLGNGGQGGNASTVRNCSTAAAQGGDGGASGNIALIATNGDIALKTLALVPGGEGSGGNASAFGQRGVDSCPGGDGGSAQAYGGDGHVTMADLFIMGNISGMDTLSVGRLRGGAGGDAEAHGGGGGKGTPCGCAGGAGGNVVAEGGNGGTAQKNPGQNLIEAHGGEGGDATPDGGPGGTGGICKENDGRGGNGGTGGSVSGKPGRGGNGTTANGRSGTLNNEKGGPGGVGGTGCPGGKGGAPGHGAPLGDFGPDGQTTCTIPPETPSLPSTGMENGEAPINQSSTGTPHGTQDLLF